MVYQKLEYMWAVPAFSGSLLRFRGYFFPRRKVFESNEFDQSKWICRIFQNGWSVTLKWVIRKVPIRKQAHIYAVRISLKNK
ncbi:hypothetical protein SAMN05878482_101700 [Peribacillus simplex]|uniref:Uncharacterized protein n=1 Tax=Peribacillus simplex TaxID=1478 RepID=A0A9X8WHR2_9BACI|nr:hypothetical protein SAMN05878482_101700 [Peribacillus simplex]